MQLGRFPGGLFLTIPIAIYTNRSLDYRAIAQLADNLPSVASGQLRRKWRSTLGCDSIKLNAPDSSEEWSFQLRHDLGEFVRIAVGLLTPAASKWVRPGPAGPWRLSRESTLAESLGRPEEPGDRRRAFVHHAAGLPSRHDPASRRRRPGRWEPVAYSLMAAAVVQLSRHVAWREGTS